MQGGAEGLAFALALQGAHLRIANFVVHEVQSDFFIVALNGKDFAEDRLKSNVLAFARCKVSLKKLDVRIDLNLNEVGRFTDFLEFTEIDSL